MLEVSETGGEKDMEVIIIGAIASAVAAGAILFPCPLQLM
jgi:hypothetical protein